MRITSQVPALIFFIIASAPTMTQAQTSVLTDTPKQETRLDKFIENVCDPRVIFPVINKIAFAPTEGILEADGDAQSLRRLQLIREATLARTTPLREGAKIATKAALSGYSDSKFNADELLPMASAQLGGEEGLYIYGKAALKTLLENYAAISESLTKPDLSDVNALYSSGAREGMKQINVGADPANLALGWAVLLPIGYDQYFRMGNSGFLKASTDSMLAERPFSLSNKLVEAELRTRLQRAATVENDDSIPQRRALAQFLRENIHTGKVPAEKSDMALFYPVAIAQACVSYLPTYYHAGNSVRVINEVVIPQLKSDKRW